MINTEWRTKCRTGWRTKCHTIGCARNTFLLLQKHLTSGTELILIGWKIVPNEEYVQCDHCFASQPLANEPLHSSQLLDTRLQKARGTTSLCGPWAALPLEARKCSAAQGPHSEVVPRAFWRLVLKSCDECKGSFARGCEAKRWSHWTYSLLGTIFQPMRINSVPDIKCFCNNKNVLRAQSMAWHFVRHPVLYPRYKRVRVCCFYWAILALIGALLKIFVEPCIMKSDDRAFVFEFSFASYLLSKLSVARKI